MSLSINKHPGQDFFLNLLVLHTIGYVKTGILQKGHNAAFNRWIKTVFYIHHFLILTIIPII